MKRHVIAAALVLALAPAAALAHGPEKHGKPAAAKAISAEEHSFGRQGDPAKVTRTVEVDMSDAMRFSPAEIRVKQGETIRFVARNGGKVMHEMVLGNLAELKAHGELMKKFPNMEHDEPYMAHVPPGKKQEIVWTFTKAGEFHFGCLLPGHFDAGMVGRILVAAAALAAGSAAAQTHHHGHAGHSGAMAQASGSAMAEGEVRKVDKGAGKVTLKHGPIASIGMPPMTMVFQVKDRAFLDRVKEGDKVRFAAEEKSGAYVVTAIEPAK